MPKKWKRIAVQKSHKTEAREIEEKSIGVLFVSLIHFGLRSIGKIEGDVPA